MSIYWTTIPDDEYLHVEFDGKPGYINIKADDDGFIIEVFPDVGDDPVATALACYNDLEADDYESDDYESSEIHHPRTV